MISLDALSWRNCENLTDYQTLMRVEIKISKEVLFNNSFKFIFAFRFSIHSHFLGENLTENQQLITKEK